MTRARQNRALPFCLAALLALPGCLAPSATDPLGLSPGARFAGQWGSRAPAPVLASNAFWWRGLGDPVLDGLVADALEDNLSLAASRARLDAAQAAVGTVSSLAAVTPSADATLSDGGVLRVGAAASFDWLLDPWGGQAARLRAARTRALAAGAEARAAELLMLLSLGTAYVDLRHAEALRGLRLAEQSRRREALTLYRSLEEAGEATRLDIVRNRARIAEIDVALPGLTSDIAAARAQIALLLGRSAAEPLPLADRSQPLPRLAPDVGVPTDLLRNRPDIHAAELAYAAAVADIDAARADLYPSLSLSGVIGYDVTDGRGAGRAVFGPSLRFPALPASGARAEVKRRHALAAEAHAIWQQTVLEAVAEVETALAAYRAAHAARGAAERAVALNREARSLTLGLVREGARTLTDLIEVEESLAAAERQLAAARRDAGRSFVALNVRLGVGRGTSAVSETK